MISQFVSPYQQRLLTSLDYDFPPGTNAVGRLDFHSEGLLILTTDKSLTRKLLHPQKQHFRRYLVLVRGNVSEATLQQLRNGVTIGVKGKGYQTTQPCIVNIVSPLGIAERVPPYIAYGIHTWLEIILTEGKNRQIRKMCKEVRHNVQRLIRTHIENLSVSDLKSGEVRELSEAEIMPLLKITS